jgi:hypothetical protein
LWPLFIGLPLIALIAVAAIVLSGGGDGASAPESRPQDSGDEGGAGSAPGSAGLGTPALGSKDAPVVLTEYSDYQ